jgi:hypothetical protein
MMSESDSLMLRTNSRQFLKSKSSQQEIVDRCSLFEFFDSVKRLSNVLRDVDDVVPLRDLTSEQEKELDKRAQGCYSVLEELKEALNKYQELDSSTKGISGKSRRVWKRLQWDQKDMDEFRSRITLNISGFNAFLGRVTR